jgi:hypothetical protein
MQSRQTTPFVSEVGVSPLVLHPCPRWFLIRGIALELVALFFLRGAGARGLGLLFAMAPAILWLLFRNSSITLDSDGFTYHSVLRRISHKWVDVERFSVVEQRAYGFITVNRFLGWDYSPAYKNYKRLAIPRTMARLVGMTHAMFKPVGFNIPELARVMNQHLYQTRTAGIGKPASR